MKTVITDKSRTNNGGRAALAHKLHAKGLRKVQALPKLRRAGFRITPSLLNRIWARFSSHAS